MSLKDTATDSSHEPFVRVLVDLCKTISRSADQIYGERHESLLQIWRVARSITQDLQELQSQAKQALDTRLDASVQPGSLEVRQTMFATRMASYNLF